MLGHGGAYPGIVDADLGAGGASQQAAGGSEGGDDGSDSHGKTLVKDGKKRGANGAPFPYNTT